MCTRLSIKGNGFALTEFNSYVTHYLKSYFELTSFHSGQLAPIRRVTTGAREIACDWIFLAQDMVQ